MRILLAILLPVSAFSFALGLTQPLMRFERLYFLEDRPSLLEMIFELWRSGDAALAFIVGLFSVGFPAAKILLIHVVVLTGGQSRSLSLLSTVGKWSMLDVMLVALVLFAAKTSGLAAAAILPGLWFYAAATLSTALAAAMCSRSAR
ncbi:paraquat-inducible protein A [Roseibium denhamense]|nr:paraquat-inducible protein A [Roseibium denhamense]MTI06737.1 paraquat-inducible protein A [Roseibium denhamense]